MIEQGHISFLVNHPMFVPIVAVTGLLLILVVGILKFLVGSRSSNIARSPEDASKLSQSGKKKKGKKLRTVQNKKGSDSPKLQKDSRRNEINSLIETDRRTIEDGKSDKRKDGKLRTKSKKKKSNQIKVETIPEPQTVGTNIDSGDWQTVSTKEKRGQLKREKKKLEENTESTLEKHEPDSSIQPFIKPTPNISAIAKGIAPRFARAAGEQWQEKPPTTVPTMQSKWFAPPATIPSARQHNLRSTTVTQQSWALGNQGKEFWSSDVGTTWSNSAVATSTNNLTPDLVGMSWTPGDTTLLSLATSSEKVLVPGWSQGGSTWQSSELERYYNIRKSYPLDSTPSHHPYPIQDQPSSPSHSSTCSDDVFTHHGPIHRTPYFSHTHAFQSEPALFQPYDPATAGNKTLFGSPSGNMTWDINTEDWVHINGQNGRPLNATAETWVGGDSPIRSQTGSHKVEEWTMEPEGFPICPPQLDPNDPWNLEIVGSGDDAGDWSAPVASWENTNSEWTAPQPTVKSAPTYFGESSDDEKISPKVVSNQPNASVVTAAPQSIVGAGPEFMTQATGQGQNKKSRRRRKKKNATTEPEQLSSPETESLKPLETQAKSEVEPSLPEAKKTDEVKDDWTVPKPSKKRKTKARKAD